MNVNEPISNQDKLLSVVVALVSDTTERGYNLSLLTECLQALLQQSDPPPIEVIVPYPAQIKEIKRLQSEFPEVIFSPVEEMKTYTIQGGSREHHDELRARGMIAAHGEIIGLLEDHARPDSNWCRSIWEAHRQKYAGVGGAIENGIDRPLNWAVYFIDFGKYQNPVPTGETSNASDANISYKRSALMDVRSIWQESFHEPEVNAALIQKGEKLTLSPDMIVYQMRKDLRLSDAINERFIWGRSYAIMRSKKFSSLQRIQFAILSLILPVILLTRMSLNVLKKQRHVNTFIKVIPLTILLTVFWSLGEMSGYLTSKSNNHQVQQNK